MVDVEVIALAMEIFRDFGIRNMGLKLNTVGCPACVPDYVEKLRKYFTGREDLCGDCVKRLEKNPMRILDCKIATCASFNEDVPRREDHVCTVCSEHFGVVTEQLTNLGVEYTIDERLVRGLDYYTRTAFEVTCPSLGAQDAIGGGGRYDGLFAQLGGKEMPAVGFASGMERVLLARLAEGEMPAPAGPDVYCCPQTTAEAPMAMQVAENLRKKGISCEINLTFRKFKQQMKEASVSGASYAMVIGEDERQNNQVTIKNMKTREQNTVKSDQVTEYIKK
jgi:histidyl-tRNA synthetase